MPSRRHRSSFAVLAAAVVSAYVVSTACSTGMPGDCVGRVRFDGVMYEPVIGVRVKWAAADAPLGRGEIVDCGSLDNAPAVESVKLVSLDDVDPSVAVLVPRGQQHRWQGLYVAEDLERSSWPAALRHAIKASGHRPAR